VALDFLNTGWHTQEDCMVTPRLVPGIKSLPMRTTHFPQKFGPCDFLRESKFVRISWDYSEGLQAVLVP